MTALKLFSIILFSALCMTAPLPASANKSVSEKQIQDFKRIYYNAQIADKTSGGGAGALFLLEDMEIDLLDGGMTQAEIDALKAQVDGEIKAQKKAVELATSKIQIDTELIDIALRLEGLSVTEIRDRLIPKLEAHPEILHKVIAIWKYLVRDAVSALHIDDNGRTYLFRATVALLILEKSDQFGISDAKRKQLAEITGESLSSFLGAAPEKPNDIRDIDRAMSMGPARFAFKTLQLTGIPRGSPVFTYLFNQWRKGIFNLSLGEIVLRVKAYRAAVNSLTPKSRRSWNIISGLGAFFLAVPFLTTSPDFSTLHWMGAMAGWGYFRTMQIVMGDFTSIYNYQFNLIRPSYREAQGTRSLLRYHADPTFKDKFCEYGLMLL